ncbi:fumarate hydratase C-terminal domain-containing protein [Salinisphaera sp. LB1]|uniref:fumarate hydratase C-terminal domain-containing protein n=1 Tax=Salinisphaera sp. LB1 TaxID=2183911 RepID=UPI000D7E4B06|nr:fumarate hydratase C-terminal domain-containing protein [Salinisphaera sp. LB1]AWN15139.1 hypothetical protein SALB1_0932 [Salinisphaera sp. LB1]
MRFGARVIAFNDLDSEAIHDFEVEYLPVTSAVDAGGHSIHDSGVTYRRRFIADIRATVE